MRNTRVVLVQCTNSKYSSSEPPIYNGVAPAKTLYSKSRYFRRQKAYAELYADKWYIQSAKYGLVEPDEEIESYDTHAKDIAQPDQWAREIAIELKQRVTPPATVEVLGGKHYANPLTPELEARGFDVVEPLRGLRIGERMAQLKYRIEEARNASLHG